MSNNNNETFLDLVKRNVGTYGKWLKTLSGGQFIVYLILTLIITGIVEGMTNSTQFISNLTALFIFATIGLKVLYKNTDDVVETSTKVDLVKAQ